MILPIADVLSASALEGIRRLLSNASTYAGSASAGWAAAAVKHNSQFDSQDELALEAEAIVSAAVKANALIQLATFAAKFTPTIMSRYQVGQCYGVHVDNVWQNGIRTDIAYTLFLSDPETYDGGELRIHDHAGVQDFKLAAGSLLLYPASTLHEVCEVKGGERLAAVGWIESRIRSHELRGVLFDLDVMRQRLHQTGEIAGYQTLSRAYGVLARQSH